MKLITRNDIIEMLQQWSNKKVSKYQLKQWANDVSFPGHIEFNDTYEDMSIAKEVLFLLECLDINLLIEEDAEVLINFLKSSVDTSLVTQENLEQYFQSIDQQARKLLLKEDDFYRKYC